MAKYRRVALVARFAAAAAVRASPRSLRNDDGGNATSRSGSKHRTRGAVARVAGARQACAVPPCSLNSHSPFGLSPDTTKKWCLNKPGSRSWPPSQQRPRSVAATNQRPVRAPPRSTCGRASDLGRPLPRCLPEPAGGVYVAPPGGVYPSRHCPLTSPLEHALVRASSPLTIHAAPAAASRSATSEYPRRARGGVYPSRHYPLTSPLERTRRVVPSDYPRGTSGGVAIRNLGISASQPRRRRHPLHEDRGSTPSSELFLELGETKPGFGMLVSSSRRP